MLASKKRWKQRTFEENQVAFMQEQLNVSSLLAKLFLSRNWTNIEEAKQILHIQENAFHDPFLLEGMREAVTRIQKAVAHAEKIRIYGDYDCDGVCSTAIIIHLLRELEANFDYYIPNRFTEGYGLNKQAMAQAKQDGVQLILTVDTGISAWEEVAYAQELGLECIITDHHEPPEKLPSCVAVVNPKKKSCTYPFPHLAGSGVAFQLAHALLGRVPLEIADIASIGTIADLVPLTGENRFLAYLGLHQLNRTHHSGLTALLECCGLRDTVINERHVGFSLGPRINASGRMGSAAVAVQLLTTNDKEEADLLAQQINEVNQERQQVVDRITKEAVQWVSETYGDHQPKALVVAQEDWHEGVLGIVASRLVEKYYVPTIVLSIDREKGVAKGSARSIEGFHMYEALSACRDSLSHFGGHPMAAGMTLPIECISSLRTHLGQLAENWLQEEDFVPSIEVDICCELHEITPQAIKELERLAPFGVQHAQPVVMVNGVSLAELRTVGTAHQHLKCTFQQGSSKVQGIGFGMGELAPQVSAGALPDIIGQLELNEWNGTQRPQIVLKDFRVTHRQFFDYRSQSNRVKWDTIHFEQQAVTCYFREPMHQGVSSPFPILSFSQEGDVQFKGAGDVHADTFILLDLPYSLQQLERACQFLQRGDRFYMFFQQDQDHFFSALPKREDFKWYYGFLQSYQPFDVMKQGNQLAQHRKCTLELIQFMTEVFLELQFVTMIDGKISLIKQPAKKELEDSQLYIRKKEEMKMEQLLLYSSFAEMVHLLENYMVNESTKEALVYGF